MPTRYSIASKAWYDYEDAIFHIDNKLKDYRELKEMYVRFNSRNAGNPTAAREKLIE